MMFLKQENGEYISISSLGYKHEDGHYELALVKPVDYIGEGCWTTNSMPCNCNKVCWSSELGIFVAVGNSGAIATSTDGITWTQQESNTINNIRSICWSPLVGMFLAVHSGYYGETGGTYSYSYDGVIWKTSQSPFLSDRSNLYEAIWASGLNQFLMPIWWEGNGGYRILMSSNGLDWSQGEAFWNDFDYFIYGACWSQELKRLCVAFSDEGRGIEVCVSDDGGQTFASDMKMIMASYEYPSARNALCWSPEEKLFIGVTSRYGNNCCSSDGINWSEQPNTDSITGECIWSPELRLFGFFGDNYFNAVTDDGITVTNVAMSTTLGSIPCWSSELGIFCVVENNQSTISKPLKMQSTSKNNNSTALICAIDDNYVVHKNLYGLLDGEWKQWGNADPFAVQSITVENLTGMIEGGRTIDLNNHVIITPTNARDKTLTWSIEWINGNQSAVSLDDNGILIFKNMNAGEVTFNITATAHNGVIGTGIVNYEIYFGPSTDVS